MYATAHGIYQAEINGTAVGDQVLAPGGPATTTGCATRPTTSPSLLREGANAIGVQLADGWFRGYLGFGGKRNVYGDRTGLFAQLEVEHPDGTRTTVASDGSWRSTLGPLTRADIYNGETFDARRELPAGRRPVSTTALGTGRCRFARHRHAGAADRPARPPHPERARRRGHRLAVGKTLVDFGQNLVGRLRLRLPDAPAGTEITVRHAEVLEDGELGTRPLRKAAQTDVVVLDGAGPRSWEPRFTFHGFRYAEITGWPGDFAADDVEAVVVHTDLRPTGTLHLLGRRREPVPRQRRLGHARQLRRRAHRLPAA